MRISVDPDDPGYANYLTHPKARIFLDGIERDCVYTADEEKRFIIMPVRDECGNLKVKDDMIVREKWTGNVHIELDQRAESSVNIQVNFGHPTIARRLLEGGDLARAIRHSLRRD